MAERDAFADVPIDEVQRYWDSRPCNVRHSPKPVGTRDYFDEVEERKYLVEPHIPGFADFARWNGKKVLEIGCGLGTDTINFARAGADVTVIELSTESLELAQQRARVFGLDDRIRFFQGNAEDLTKIVRHDTYDLVYSFGVIHHTPHPERVLEGIATLVRPGTTVKIMVYHRLSWKTAMIVLRQGRGRFWRARQLIAEHSEAQIGSPVTYTYSRAELVKLLAGFGLRTTDVFIDHIFPYRIKDYVEYRYVKEWYWRVMPRPLFRALERTLGWHLCVTAVAEGRQG